MPDDDTSDEQGHGLKPARGVMFGLVFTAIGVGVICGLCILGLALT